MSPSAARAYSRRRCASRQRTLTNAIAVAVGNDANTDAGVRDAGAGAEHGCVCRSPFDGVGRVASRPGYPAEPAARSRPFGRVSLAPPLPSVAARSACPAARFAHRRCRADTLAARFDGTGVFTAVSSSRRRCAPRSSSTSPRSPWPAAGSASARRRGTPCVAGDGFAVHRAPHCVVHRWPHQCGHHRHRLRQRAAHDCPRLRPHRPPLKRRGGSRAHPAPAAIPSSLSLGFQAIATPCGVQFSHRNAPMVPSTPSARLTCIPVRSQRHETPRLCRIACSLSAYTPLSHPCRRMPAPDRENTHSDCTRLPSVRRRVTVNNQFECGLSKTRRRDSAQRCGPRPWPPHPHSEAPTPAG